MDQDNATTEVEKKDEIEITIDTGILRNSIKLLKIRVTTSKERFSMADALSQHCAFPSLANHLEAALRNSVKEYLERANDVVRRAAELGRHKSSRK